MPDFDFDIPDVEGLDEKEPAQEFDFDVPDVVENHRPAQDPAQSDLDALNHGSALGPEDLAVLDGLLLNNAGDLGNAGLKTGLPQLIARHLPGAPSHNIDGMAPEYAHGPASDPDMNALYALAEGTPGGKAAQLAGNVVTGAAAPAGALSGAATGAVSAGGATNWDDVLSVLTGGAVGGVLGGLGNLAGKGLDKAREFMGDPSNAAKMLAEAGANKNPFKALWHPWDNAIAPRLQEAAVKVGQNIPAAAGKFASGASDVTAATLPTVASSALSALGGKAVSALTSKASAQDTQAYGTFPTLAWSVQSVLSSGNSGLPPDAEQQLTEAAMSGDDSKVIATNFKLQQRFPAYAKRIQDELKSLNDQG